MQLLVSTHNGLFLCNLDSLSIAGILEGYFYGIAKFEDNFIVAERVEPRSKTSPTKFHRFHEVHGPIDPPTIDGNQIIDVHQMTAGDRGLYFCNAGRGALSFVPFNTQGYEEIVLAGFKEHGALVNSVYVEGEDVYFILHNRDKKPSDIFWFKHREEHWISCYLYSTSFFGIHNVIKDGDVFYFNASDDGSVVRLHTENYFTEDWDSKEKIDAEVFKFGRQYHTKGMALKDDLLIIGLSANGNREERFQSASKIVLIDVKYNKVIDQIYFQNPFGGELGNINEIRIL